MKRPREQRDGPLKEPPRQNDRGLPRQPGGDHTSTHGSHELNGPRTPPDHVEPLPARTPQVGPQA